MPSLLLIHKWSHFSWIRLPDCWTNRRPKIALVLVGPGEVQSMVRTACPYLVLYLHNSPRSSNSWTWLGLGLPKLVRSVRCLYRWSTLFLHHHPLSSKWCLSMSKSLLDLVLTLHTSFGYFWTLLNTPKVLTDNLRRSCPILPRNPNSTQLLLWLHFFLQVNK